MNSQDIAITTQQIEEYRARRRKQMLLFFGAAGLTLLSSRIAYRGVQIRKYIPNTFNANHQPPPFSFQRDAMAAISHATCLAVSSFAMGITGVCWLWNVSTIKEFTFKLKKKLGGVDSEDKLSSLPMDQETKDIQLTLSKFFQQEIASK